jgi:hypothetical protein
LESRFRGNTRKESKHEPNFDRNNKIAQQNSNENENLNSEKLKEDDMHKKLRHREIDSNSLRNLFLKYNDIEMNEENNLYNKEHNLNEFEKETQNVQKSATETTEELTESQTSTKSQIQTEKSISLPEDIQPVFKVILMWSPFFYSWDIVSEGSQTFIDAKCLINKCTLTSDKLHINQSDAIVFNARDLVVNKMPNMRSPNQTWILFSSEAPNNSYFKDFDDNSNSFNWSWTYRSDSDIVFSFGKVQPIDHQNYINYENFKDFNAFDTWRRKNKMIFWLSNDCETQSKREIYVNELKKHVDVDIYGKCGSNKCPQSSKEEKQLNKECFKTLAKQYLFAIVFEDSYCKDYITENVFNALEHNIVPIVMSGADYTRILPSNSVINALNFISPKDFADYLLDIGADFNKYKAFFEWKRQYQVNYQRNDLCQLCSKLHDKNQHYKSYANITNWWLNEAQCKQWNAEFNNIQHL